MKFNLCLIGLFVLLLIFIPMLRLPSSEGDREQLPLEQIPASTDFSPIAENTEEWDIPEASANVEAVVEESTKLPLWQKVNRGKTDLNFRILNQSTGQVETIGYEDYVKGAICSEMPPDFHLEAMKAQGVAALTYALYNQNMNRDADVPALLGADFAADPLNWKVYVTEEIARNRYGDKFDTYWGKICEAAEEASKMVMVYEGEPILAAYHSTSSGVTEGAENVWNYSLPYLVPVTSRGDLQAPQYETEMVLSVNQMKDALTASLPEVDLGDDPSDWLEVLERSEGGYVTSVRVGDQILHGKELRAILDLRSSDFTLSCNGDSFALKVYGYGHGVGLSQSGADFMAMQGATASEILQHYFTGVTLMDLEDFLEQEA